VAYLALGVVNFVHEVSEQCLMLPFIGKVV